MNKKEIITTKQPVKLVGYQAIMRQSRYGHLLECITSEQELIDELEADRIEYLKYCSERIENPRQALLKPAPWIEVNDGYNMKFSWKPHARPPVVDTVGTLITSESFPLYAGSLCQLAIYQIPYILGDKITYGTTIRLAGIQVVSLGKGEVKEDVFSVDEARRVFGIREGFTSHGKNADDEFDIMAELRKNPEKYRETHADDILHDLSDPRYAR